MADEVCLCEDEGCFTGEIVQVIEDLRKNVPEGHVPVILYRRKKGKRSRKATVPAISLSLYGPCIRRYKSSRRKRGDWGDFFEGDPVSYNGRDARVAAAAAQEVFLGHVPVFYEDVALKHRRVHLIPADDLVRR
jgi:hypothetical protein